MSWTEVAKPLPCVPPDPAAGAQIFREFQQHQPIVLTPLYEASCKANPQVTQRAFFPLQNINGSVLCLSGDDDKMWNSSAQCAMAIQYLQAHHHPYPDAQLSVSRCRAHVLIRSSRPAIGNHFGDGRSGNHGVGGTPDGDAASAEAAWPKIWEFLSTALGAR